MRDQRTVSQVLARSLNSTEGGSGPMILETTGNLQILQPIAVPSTEEGSLNPAKGSLVYMEITPHTSHRIGMDEDEKKKKEENEMVKNDSGIVKREKGKMKKKETLV